MNSRSSRFLLSVLFIIFLSPLTVSAHQPRLVESRVTKVPVPEISKAYYGTLTGEPDVYIITQMEPFDLYVNVLVPDIAGQKKDVSSAIIKDGDTENPLAVLDGTNFEWKKFYEPFGADTYWMGPEYKKRVEAGTYEIRVWSSNNDSKYSLAIGEIEAFDGQEGMHALTLIPKLKSDFFNESPIGFIRSPMGWGLIVVMYIAAAIAGLALRIFMKIVRKLRTGASAVTPQNSKRNIGSLDRLVRLGIAMALLLWAVTTTWSPILIFFSGFAFFEAVFGWCGFYAVLGKNTCPVKM